MVAGRDAEIVDSFSWEDLDPRFKEHPPRLSIGLVYCERPSAEERARMMKLDEGVKLTPEQRFDTSVPVPSGSSYDLARKSTE